MRESLFNKIASRVTYPLTMVFGVGLTYQQLYLFDWSLLSIVVPVSLAFLICAVMERLLPYRAKWNQSHDDVQTDAVYIGVNLALREGATVLLKVGLIAVAAHALGNDVAPAFWPDQWHPLLQMLLAILVLDFFEYWFHRASHRIGFLWRFHAIHHSPKRLYFFNASRFHFVDWLTLTTIEVAILFALGAEAEVIALAAVFVQIHGLFQHANIKTKLGWLNYVFSCAELHRWHHSKLVAESDRNFGNNVIVWDLLFGTFFLPKDREVGVLGLMNPDYPPGFLGQLLAPFGRKVDKPADYAARKAAYLEQLEIENQLELDSVNAR